MSTCTPSSSHLYVHWFTLNDTPTKGVKRQFMRLTTAPSERVFRAHYEVLYGRPCEDAVVAHPGAAEYFGILDDDMMSYFRLYGPANRVVAGVWEVQWEAEEGVRARERESVDRFIAERVRKYVDSQVDDLHTMWQERLRATALVAARDGTLATRRAALEAPLGMYQGLTQSMSQGAQGPKGGSFADRCERDSVGNYVLDTLDVIVLLEMAWKVMTVSKFNAATPKTSSASSASSALDTTDIATPPDASALAPALAPALALEPDDLEEAGGKFFVSANYVSAKYPRVWFDVNDAQMFIGAVIGGTNMFGTADPTLVAHGLHVLWDAEMMAERVSTFEGCIGGICMEWGVVDVVNEIQNFVANPVKNGAMLSNDSSVHVCLWGSLLCPPHFVDNTFNVLLAEATDKMLDRARRYLRDHPKVATSKVPVYLNDANVANVANVANDANVANVANDAAEVAHDAAEVAHDAGIVNNVNNVNIVINDNNVDNVPLSLAAVHNLLVPAGRVTIGPVSPIFAEFEALSPVTSSKFTEKDLHVVQHALDLMYSVQNRATTGVSGADTFIDERSQIVQSVFRIALKELTRPAPTPVPKTETYAPSSPLLVCDLCACGTVSQKTLITHFVHRYLEAFPNCFDQGPTMAATLIGRVHEFLLGVHKKHPKFAINRNLISMTLEECRVSKRRMASGVKFACSEPDAAFVASLVNESYE